MVSDKFKEDCTNAHQLAEWFLSLEKTTELRYRNKEISRKERNTAMKSIRADWDATMKENDPLLKNNHALKEIAKNLRLI